MIALIKLFSIKLGRDLNVLQTLGSDVIKDFSSSLTVGENKIECLYMPCFQASLIYRSLRCSTLQVLSKQLDDWGRDTSLGEQ